MATCRVVRDIHYLQRHIDKETNGQGAVDEVDDNMQFLLLTLQPNDGFYRGAKIRFKLLFDLYPNDAPTVMCLDNVYHPNIDPTQEEDLHDPEGGSDFDGGSNVCVSLLNEWESSMRLDHVVMALLYLLYYPNPDDALSPYFGSLQEPDDLEVNIRKALRGGNVEGRDWARLLPDDYHDDHDDEGKKTDVAEKDGDGGGDQKKVDDGDDDAVAKDGLDESALEEDEVVVVTRTEEVDGMDKKQPTPSQSANTLIPSDLGSSVDGHHIAEKQDSSSTDTTIGDVDLSRITMLNNYRNLTSVDARVPSSFSTTDLPCKCMDVDNGVDGDCEKITESPPGKSLTDSLGMSRLFSCSGFLPRTSGSGIKALFSCFQGCGDHGRQFPSTASGVDGFGDCEQCDVD